MTLLLELLVKQTALCSENDPKDTTLSHFVLFYNLCRSLRRYLYHDHVVSIYPPGFSKPSFPVIFLERAGHVHPSWPDALHIGFLMFPANRLGYASKRMIHSLTLMNKILCLFFQSWPILRVICRVYFSLLRWIFSYPNHKCVCVMFLTIKKKKTLIICLKHNNQLF